MTAASQLYWLLVASVDVANVVAVAMKMIRCSCYDFVRSIEYQLIVNLDLDESSSILVLESPVYSRDYLLVKKSNRLEGFQGTK